VTVLEVEAVQASRLAVSPYRAEAARVTDHAPTTRGGASVSMTTDERTRALDVAGDDQIELRATEDHQPELVPLIRRRPHDLRTVRRTARVVPRIDDHSRCDLEADGRVVGELPAALADEVHNGLLALAMLEPPYQVEVLLRLEWRERREATSIGATALIDLDGLRLLAC
jgi:hypothetical protein